MSKTFAAVVPLGFEGGHGVVAGFKEALEVDNPDGYNQGTFFCFFFPGVFFLWKDWLIS